MSRLLCSCHNVGFTEGILTESEDHLHFLRLALAEAEKCEPTPTAFCVGCVLTCPTSDASERVILTTGYSRELPGNTHAEAHALTKARSLSPARLAEFVSSASIDDIFSHTDVYTTMEPCSVRSSGLSPCADALIDAKVRRCFIGVQEPDDFVQCEGAQKLMAAGIEVIWIKGLEEACLNVARRGHKSNV
jgi:pyrimidine deaminase RibD-like protein